MESGSLLSEALERMKEWHRLEEEDYRIFYQCGSSSLKEEYHPKNDCLQIDLCWMNNNNNNNNDNNNNYDDDDNLSNVNEQQQNVIVYQKVINDELQRLFPKKYLWHVGGEAGFYFQQRCTNNATTVWTSYVRYGPSCHIDEWMIIAIIIQLLSSLEKKNISLAATFIEVENGYSLLGMEACQVLPPELDEKDHTIYWYQNQVWYSTTSTTTYTNNENRDHNEMVVSPQMTIIIEQKVKPFISFLQNDTKYNQEWTHTTAIVLPRILAEFFQHRPDLACAAICSIPYSNKSVKRKIIPDWNQDLVMTTMTLPKTNFAILASSNETKQRPKQLVQTMEWKRMKRTYGTASPHLQHATTYGMSLCVGVYNILTYTIESNHNHKSLGICPLTYPEQSVSQQIQSFFNLYHKKKKKTSFSIPTMLQVDSQDWMILPTDENKDNNIHSALEQYMMEIVQQQQQQQQSNLYPVHTKNSSSEENMMDQLYKDVQSFIHPNVTRKSTSNKKIVNIQPKIAVHMLSSIFNDKNDTTMDLEVFFTKQDIEMEHDLETQLVDHFSSNSSNKEEDLHLLSNWLQSLDSQTQLNGPVTNMLNEFISSSNKE